MEESILILIYQEHEEVWIINQMQILLKNNQLIIAKSDI